jgi:hypothetical protein
MNKETELEMFENVSYRIREEGMEYCFEHYSRWEEIKDKKFHELRKAYLNAAKELKNYIEIKKIELNNTDE